MATWLAWTGLSNPRGPGFQSDFCLTGCGAGGAVLVRPGTTMGLEIAGPETSGDARSNFEASAYEADREVVSSLVIVGLTLGFVSGGDGAAVARTGVSVKVVVARRLSRKRRNRVGLFFFTYVRCADTHAHILSDAFYGVEDDPALHDVDVVTDVSMAPTAFTRYTVAPTTTSKSSK